MDGELGDRTSGSSEYRIPLLHRMVCSYMQKARSPVSKTRQLHDATYTKAEVVKIIDKLSGIATAEVENELANFSHITFLLLRQLMSQAEKNGLSTFINLSEAESGELLRAVGTFEREMVEKKQNRSNTVLSDSSDVDRAVANQQRSLIEENMRLRAILEKNGLSAEVESSIRDLKHQLTEKGDEAQRLKEMSLESKTREQELTMRLNTMNEQLKTVNEQLAMKGAELEKKFANTNTYINMQKILTSKNQMIKQLRQTLAANNIKVADRLEVEED